MTKIVLLTVLLFSQFTFAEVIQCESDVKFNDFLSINDTGDHYTDLVVNGIGLKRILFFKVFYAALYLENKSQKAADILESDEIKVGVIHTRMGLKREQFVKMWNDEFERLCNERCQELRPFHEKFLSFARDVKKNERLYMLMFPDRFEFEANHDEFYDPIYSPGYANLIQRVLIGPEADDKNLEKSLLGKTPYCQ